MIDAKKDAIVPGFVTFTWSAARASTSVALIRKINVLEFKCTDTMDIHCSIRRDAEVLVQIVWREFTSGWLVLYTSYHDWPIVTKGAFNSIQDFVWAQVIVGEM
jgi:hypothetical protein